MLYKQRFSIPEAISGLNVHDLKALLRVNVWDRNSTEIMIIATVESMNPFIVSIVDGTLNITGGTCDEDVVAVCVPRGTNLTLQAIDGKTVIDDLEGDLTAVLNGSHRLSCGNIRNLNITSNSTGEVIIVKVVGDSVRAVIGSDGRVAIGGGNVRDLTIINDGNGDFIFGGTYTNLTLTGNGQGKIYIE